MSRIGPFNFWEQNADNTGALGRENGKRAFYMHLYVRLRNGKIHIEKDATEDGIAAELVREGVPREDIVLAFHPPALRQFTDFAAV
jgi:hypothetical protein